MLHGLGNSGRLVSNLTPAANLGRKTVLRVLGLEGGTVVVEHGLLDGTSRCVGNNGVFNLGWYEGG